MSEFCDKTALTEPEFCDIVFYTIITSDFGGLKWNC